MTTPVELIVGPARSGKAARVLAAYADALRQSGPGGSLMLVPTVLRRRATETRLLAALGTDAILCPQVLTLPDLADRLLRAAGRTVRRIHELARRRVIRDCLDALSENDARPLGDIRAAPGLVDALDALFRELKAARVEPDAFGRALAGPIRTPRNRLLARLYGAYQQRLQDLDVYDDQGLFWHAAALLDAGAFGPFGDLALLAVDGFQRFDPAQLHVVAKVSERARRTVITLVWDEGRPHLFGLTGRTRQRLRERFGDRLVETRCDEPSGLPADLERIRTRLFLAPGGEDDRPAPEGQVRLIQAAGRTREVEEVARQAVDLVRAGATEPASIAVIARSLDAYAGAVPGIFAQYGLPVRVEAGVPLRDCPVVRAAIAMVRLQAEDFGWRAVARVLRSGYIRPEAFGADVETARAAVRLGRDARVWTGREAWFRGFEALRGRLERESGATNDFGDRAVTPERAAERARDIDRAEALLGRLFEAATLPAAATRRAFADAFLRMILVAGLWKTALAHAQESDRARDLRALEGLQAVLDEVALLDATDGETVPLAQFLDELTRGLAVETVQPAEPPDAPVVVLDVNRCQALTFQHVFLVGLAEKAFPVRGRRHPFFDDAERATLRGRGIDLADTAHAAQEEMLRFYLAAGRAERTLTLSYPSLDAQGRPQLASHYVEELRSLFAETPGGPAVPETEVGVRDLGLPAERARSRRELVAATAFALWGRGANPKINRDLAVLSGLAADGPAVETALAGLAAERERERGEAFGPFDGCLAGPDILEDLCRRFPGESSMSAHRLERFGQCPFAFLAADILQLEPREEPSPELAPMDLGLIIHDLLDAFFRAVAGHPKLAGRITEDTLDVARGLLEQTAEAYWQRIEATGGIGSPALWRVVKRDILRDLVRLLAWHASNLADWRVAATEASFGSGKGGADAVEVPTDHGPLRLRGRIDRIDRRDDACQVVDYKSGSSSPSPGDMKAGTSFQLPLYLWAAEAMLGPVPADALRRGFFLPVRRPAKSAALSNQGRGKHPEGTLAPAQTRAAEYIRRFVAAIRHGRFPVYPRAGCPGHCDYHGICRFAEWQSTRKWEAAPIPELELLPDDDPAEADAPADASASRDDGS